MSFREKRAWISFVVLFLISSIYFVWLFKATHLDPDGPPSFHVLGNYFLVAAGLLVVLEAAFYGGFRLFSPKEARTPRDEREILIGLRAVRIAYTVLIVLAVITSAMVVHAPGGAQGIRSWLLGNLVLLGIVIAQLVKYGTEIVFYRRES